MADNPRKVGVYDSDDSKTGAVTGAASQKNWWIIALVVLAAILALYFVL